jgi:Bacterial SH3 domain
VDEGGLKALSDQQLMNLLENAKRLEVSEIVHRCKEILDQRKIWKCKMIKLSKFILILVMSQLSVNFSYAMDYYYVYNTSPPDAFLALRSEPTTKFGQRIAIMPNGTKLEVLDKRSDGWWLVKIVESNQVGWTLSSNGVKNWIACCQYLDQNIKTYNDTRAALPITEPKPGSSDRTAIMDSLRFTFGANTKFIVSYIRVVRQGNAQLSFVDVTSADKNLNIGGMFLIENKGNFWKPIYQIGGDGADSCGNLRNIISQILFKSESYNVPRNFFSEQFWKINSDTNSLNDDDMCDPGQSFN